MPNHEGKSKTKPAEDTDKTDDEELTPLAKAIGGLKLRGIGPAFMGGRIADIAVDPDRPATWYLAIGSGGVWKTTNAGTTWQPVFDEQKSYSIGCITLDPTNPSTVWVGAGESVSGRHVAWGDGVYRSRDAGTTWENMGLKASEHVGGIDIDPRDGSTVVVAAEGPLWSSGGERGVYRSTDGGETWNQTLEIDDDTGVTSLVRMPDNPDVMLAASYQRRRHVGTFASAGPGSGIHKSTDGGLTWRQVSKGLPEGDMGKIGLAVTQADPRRVYATIEAAEDERGLYYSGDGGESWERRSHYIAGGTGPHYYQELFASPVDADKIYQVDVFLHVSTDGGRTFTNMETGRNKHSDNHVVWIDPTNPDHLLVGCDAGLYETFDDGTTYRHFPNLPIAQFYRIAADNSEPFYNILAGAQDLGTLYGPSRTANVDGVRNQDWSVPLGADGYHAAFDPEDPDISYIEWQVGNVMRHDRRTMQLTDIRPVGDENDDPERWNWDCPIVISPHDNNRIYLASQRVWRSDDRGDSWRSVSGDLTTARNRYEMPTFATVPGVTAPYDHMAMSQYATISHMCESPVAEGVLYVGTDDGRIHVTADDGQTWEQTATPPGLPETAFINNVKASEHEADVVFVVADNHKFGEFKPYVYRSDDRGRTWESIAGDLPEDTIVWTIEQDHVDPDLLFVGAEFGLHVTLNGGASWHKLSGGVPTISFRDVKLHRRDDDLVAGSFGRGIYILDDYGPLRDLADTEPGDEPLLLSTRDAWWYVPHTAAQAEGQPTLGSTAYRAPNPDFGAVFTYVLPEDVQGPTKKRQENEKEERKAGRDVAIPDLETLYNEQTTAESAVVLVIRDEEGQPVRQLAAETKKGLHRTAWDLRRASPDPQRLEEPDFVAPWERPLPGPLVSPGRYTAELVLLNEHGRRQVGQTQAFEVRPIPELADLGAFDDQFVGHTLNLERQAAGLERTLEQVRERVILIRRTLRATAADGDMDTRLEAVHRQLEDSARLLVGDPVAWKLDEASPPSASALVGRVAYMHWRTTTAPTSTQRSSLVRGERELVEIKSSLEAAMVQLDGIAAELDSQGGTWTPR